MSDLIGKNMSKIRKSKGVTQRELADFLGTSPSAIAMWETGKREPDFETLAKLSEYFSVTTDYLLGITDEPVQVDTFIDKTHLTPTEKNFLILARHAEKIPDEEREKLQNTISDTIELYLSRINKK